MRGRRGFETKIIASSCEAFCLGRKVGVSCYLLVKSTVSPLILPATDGEVNFVDDCLCMSASASVLEIEKSINLFLACSRLLCRGFVLLLVYSLGRHFCTRFPPCLFFRLHPEQRDTCTGARQRDNTGSLCTIHYLPAVDPPPPRKTHLCNKRCSKNYAL